MSKAGISASPLPRSIGRVRSQAGGASMKIKEVMTSRVECVRPETTLQEAAAKMKSLNVGPLPVCEGDKPVGIVTDRDIVIRAISEGRDPRTTAIRDVMTKDVVTVLETDD